MTTDQEIIKLLKLEPLPEEGGWFHSSYLSSEQIPHNALPPRYTDSKLFGSAIYYLLTDQPDSFSALHKLPTDEIYHFYLGDPVEMLLLHPNGKSQRVVLGQDILNSQQVQFAAPRDSWQGSYLIPGGGFALLGTTMAPAYTQDDFILGERQPLVQQYPQVAELIKRLTRTNLD